MKLASVAAVSLAIACFECGSHNNSQACAPGSTEQCFCSATALGAQQCASDGTRWEQCICDTSATSGASSGSRAGSSGAAMGSGAGMSGDMATNSSGAIGPSGSGGSGSASAGSPGVSTGNVSASGFAGMGTGRLSSSGSSGRSGAPVGDDGTTGKVCLNDLECQTVAGTNRCSNDYTIRITGVPVKTWGTGVCIKALPTTAQNGNCDPTDALNDPRGQIIHFCDGPDTPSSPGICLPIDPTAPQPGQGICYPKCTFKNDGTPATGCAGHNACSVVTYAMDPVTHAATGYGSCQGSCAQDSDCADLPAPAGEAGTYHCQTDIGYCTTAPIAKRAKNLGDACSNVGAVNDVTQGACNCVYGTANVGFCSTVCTIGGPPCPNGWVCDTGQPASLSFVVGAPNIPVPKPTTGMLGSCAPSCKAGGPATQCPTNSTCASTSIAGPDCQP